MIEDGGPAYPSQGGLMNRGMSVRDWFASQSLTEAEIMYLKQHYLASPSVTDKKTVTLSQLRYFHADQMLKQREVEPPFVPTTNAQDTSPPRAGEVGHG